MSLGYRRNHNIPGSEVRCLLAQFLRYALLLFLRFFARQENGIGFSCSIIIMIGFLLGDVSISSLIRTVPREDKGSDLQY